MYDTLRHFADSWGLVFMTVVFIGVVLWVLRPGARRKYREQANIPFKYEEPPQRRDRDPASKGGENDGQ